MSYLRGRRHIDTDCVTCLLLGTGDNKYCFFRYQFHKEMSRVPFNLGKKGRKKKEKLSSEHHVSSPVNKFHVHKINHEIEDDSIRVWRIALGKTTALLKER